MVHEIPRSIIISRYFSYWLGGLPQVTCFPIMVTIIHYIENLKRKKVWERRNTPLFLPSACLSKYICLLLPMDYTVHHLLPCFVDLRLRLSYTTNFPGPPTCIWKILGFQNLYNLVSQFFIRNTCILLNSISLENSN
jgi:hypothetical protein